MRARAKERIIREARQWFSDYGVDMGRYDRGELNLDEEVCVTAVVVFTQRDNPGRKLQAHDIYYKDTGEILELQLSFS